jgi:hypothetical protein
VRDNIEPLELLDIITARSFNQKKNLDWIDFRVKPRDLGQRLAQKLAIDLELDPSKGCEIGDISKDRQFPGSITILDKEIAIEQGINA